MAESKPVRKRMASEQRREQILLAARQVFVEKGLDGARTRDIAAAAGINEAMLYRHFDSKDELFKAAVSAPLQAAVAALVGRAGEPPEAYDETGEAMRERTRQFIADLVAVMGDVAEMLGVALFRETAVASAYYQHSIAPTLEVIEELVRTNLQHWSHSDFDTRFMVQVVFGTAWFHVTAAKLEGRTVDAPRVSEQMVELIFEGVFRGAAPSAR